MTQWGLDTLFNPAKRHMDEEKRRLQATRQQVGDTSGGKRIDLESGKVRIGKPDSDDLEADELEGDAVDASATEAVEDAEGAVPAKNGTKTPAKTAAKESAKESAKDLTPAQLRAAQRRGRAPR